jgi:hypothetical protein
MIQTRISARRLRLFTTTTTPPVAAPAPPFKGNGALYGILGAAGLGAGAYYYSTISSAPIPALSKDEFIPFKLSAVQVKVPINYSGLDSKHEEIHF